MLPEGINGRQARLKMLEQRSPQRFERMRKTAGQLAIDASDMNLAYDKIDAAYYDVGMGKSYVRAMVDFFKAAGTISAYAAYYILSLPLKIFFLFIGIIEQWACNVASSNNQLGAGRRFVQACLNVTTRQALFFAAATGASIESAGRNHELAFGINRRFVKDLRMITSTMFGAGLIIVMAVSVVLEQVFGHYVYGEELFQMSLTPVITTIVISAVIGAAVISLIDVVNLSIITVHNITARLVIKTRTRAMPKQLKRVNRGYNILDPLDRFQFKESIRCLMASNYE